MTKNNIIRIERAEAAHDQLTHEVLSLIKGMLRRGDKQSDIAAFFLINSGRVAETNRGHPRNDGIEEAPIETLPPPGPYPSPYLLWKVCQAGKAIEGAVSTLQDVIAIYKLGQ